MSRIFLYNIKSNSCIFHKEQCRYVAHKEKENLGYFYTVSEARSAGFKACKICIAYLTTLYKKEEKKILSYAAYNGLSVKFYKDYIKIVTPRSEWKILFSSESRRLQLYHKNIQNFKHDTRSYILGYHLQNAKSSTILGFMKYIFHHETFRYKHPVVLPPPPPSSPRKGTKRYRKEIKKKKLRDKILGIKGVLNIIDFLNAEK